jgi:hypothetical protein
MIIDFKEIPPGNKGGEGQDQFELFGRDFLEELGFKIIQHPSRGPDGKKDMIVFGSIDGSDKINWLVSCKHNVHSKTFKAVREEDEINPLERIKSNNCKGFIGIYSTIASSGWSERLLNLHNEFPSEIFDHRRIEKQIVHFPERHTLFWRYFTNSYSEYKQYLNDMETNNKQTVSSLAEEDILRINKTALIIIELEKIKEKYYDANWDERENVIRELFKYSDHTNLKVADHIFTFLSDAADQTRAGMTQNVAISIFSLTINFFPYSEDDNDRDKIIELATQCVNTAFSMVYDASIYMKDYNVIMCGLTILKYIYKKGKQQNFPTLMVKVDTAYAELEETLQRRERNDLTDILDLVQIFKEDRKEGTLSFPLLTEKLHKLIYSNR